MADNRGLTGGLVALGLLGLGLYACGTTAKPTVSRTSARGVSDEATTGASFSDVSTTPSYSDVSYPSASDDGDQEREPFDEDAARQKAEDDLADDTYVSASGAYGCTLDCSGHEAGWRFRAQRGYQGHNFDSPSFEEGGRAFDETVDDKVEEMRSAYEAGEDVE